MSFELVISSRGLLLLTPCDIGQLPESGVTHIEIFGVAAVSTVAFSYVELGLVGPVTVVACHKQTGATNIQIFTVYIAVPGFRGIVIPLEAPPQLYPSRQPSRL